MLGWVLVLVPVPSEELIQTQSPASQLTEALLDARVMLDHKRVSTIKVQ